MNEFTEKFHASSGNKYPYVRISSVTISRDGKKTAVSLLFDKKFSEDYKANKQEIVKSIKSLLPPDVYPEYEDKAVEANAEEVLNSIYGYLKENNVFLMYAITKDMIGITTGDNVVVKLSLPDSVHQYFNRGGYKEKLAEYLSSVFFCVCSLTVTSKSENPEDIKKALNVVVHKAKYSYERENEGRVIIPGEREKLIGDLIEDKAVYISDCNEAQNYTVICGNVNDYKIREFTSAKDNKQKKFATFNLTDETGSMRCSFFPRVGDEAKLERLYDGVFLIVSGRTDFDEYLHDGSVKLSVKRITFAKMQENFSINNIVRLPNDDYFYVKPVKKQFAEQYSLAHEDNETLSRIGAPLVLFELKTAATSGKSGVLLEIGAVKIEGGRIIYTFSSLIKPDVKLPPKLVSALGINETDYLHSPSADQVIPDFYLFTQGCDITAYPSSENFSALAAAYRKLHIPLERTQDISAFIKDVEVFKAAKPKGSRSALAFAESYAKILI